MNNHIVLKAFIGLLLSVSLCPALFAAQFYVYKDKYGSTHIVDSVTPDAAKYGYKIVNDNGVTLKKVSSVSYQERKAKERRVDVESHRDKEVREKRASELQRRFGSLAEIREIGNKKILGFQSQIDTTRNYIKSFEGNLIILEAQASKHQEGGKKVPKDDQKAISSAKENIQKNLRYIELRRVEQRKVREEYMVLIDEYKEYMSIDD